MTTERLKQNQPELFNFILQQGVLEERKRALSWCNLTDGSTEEILYGINSGKKVGQEIEEFYSYVDNKLTNHKY